MAEPIDPRFGQAIKSIRDRCDWKQSEVADRISTYYSNERSYRRIENGERLPGREAALAILTNGLQLTSVPEINHLLSLAGYAGLTNDEVAARGLQPSEQMFAEAGATEETEQTASEIKTADRTRLQLLGPAVALIVVVVSALMLAWVGLDLAAPILAGLLYAGLYVVSLLLETAYGKPPSLLLLTSSMAFGIVLISCDLALLADVVSIENGSTYGLLFSVALILFGTVAQWFVVRRILPDIPVVATNFQSHTAQAAHLKNTGYFLLLILFFWAPPVDTVLHLRSLAAGVNRPGAESFVGRPLFIGHGMFSLGLIPLLVILVLMLLISIPMGSRLTENVKPSPKRNRYLMLFYVRAFVYFGTAVLCLGWFAYSLGGFTNPPR